jgi:hypothetical protein
MCETQANRLNGRAVDLAKAGTGRAPRLRVKGWTLAVLGAMTVLVVLLWTTSGTERPRTAIGTAGHETAEPEDSPATLHDLETVTGAVDQHEWVGSRVDFHVKIAGVANDTSFWVGSKDNRMLVVNASPNGVQPVIPDQMARIRGTIDMRRELKDQKVYIRADSVIPER